MPLRRFLSPVILTALFSALAHASVIVTTILYANKSVSGASRDVGIWVESWTEQAGTTTHSHRSRRKIARLEESEEGEESLDKKDAEAGDEDSSPTAATSSGGTIYGEEEVDTPVKMIRPPVLRYPASAYRDGIEGDVELFLIVDEQGQVAEIEIVSETNHIFNRAAQEAARSLRFTPAFKNKVPARVHVHWTCRFRLE